jgi:uncharacterized protein (DUF1015 family)
MAFIYPFKGVRYKNAKDEIIAPPYDVIDSNYRNRLIARSPNNIVKIILPETYDKARELLDEWLKNRVLEFDKECSFYLYTAEYEFDSVKKTLRGFLGALKLEEFGGSIKPHEKTLKGPKIDRFNLITKTNAMFCPIMGFYNPKTDIQSIIDITIKNKKPIVDVEFEDIRHRIYAMDEVAIIHKALLDENIIIADGHHRYETALMIKEYFNKQGIKHGGFDYIMTLFVDAENGGLSLFPIHRLVKKVDDFDSFKNRLNEYFDISKDKDGCEFIMYHNKQFYCLKFKQKRKDDLIKKLDVSIFEEYVYKGILNLSEDDIKNQKIAGYAHSKEEVIELVDKKEADVGFILNAMDYSDLVKIANKGLTVPQKSTFFHPKIPSGLVGYHFDSIQGCDNV